MAVRGVRGAITVERDSADDILSATRELLEAIVKANGIAPGDVASVIFTSTPDLTAAFPARAARDMGWIHTALIGAQEAEIDQGLGRCIRVLIHWNTELAQDEVTHMYMRRAKQLRRDLVEGSEE